MQNFYTSVILLINQSNEIGEKQVSVFGSRGGQISPLMHVPLCKMTDRRNKKKLCQSFIVPSNLKSKAVNHGRQYELVAV